MFAVPAKKEKNHVTRGAMKTMRLGFARIIRSAILTMQSIPPAACIVEAAVTTAKIIRITSTGAPVGRSPKT